MAKISAIFHWLRNKIFSKSFLALVLFIIAIISDESLVADIKELFKDIGELFTDSDDISQPTTPTTPVVPIVQNKE